MTYAELCDELFAAIENFLDDQDHDLDYESNGNICEITMPNGTQLVINRQPPMEEIWLAAKSGGYHFRYVDGSWHDTRDHTEFFARLTECLAAQE